MKKSPHWLARISHQQYRRVRDAGEPSAPEMVCADSFHTGGTLLQRHDGARMESSVTTTGSYDAPPGPDWGWRIALERCAPDELLLQMCNITPAGEAARAVEAKRVRS